MGLFKQKYNTDRVELAYQLFKSLSLGGSPSYEYKADIDRIYAECTDRQKGYAPQKTLLLKVIELAGKPDTPKQRYLLGIAYAWLGAKYRQQAIEYLESYINGPLIDKRKFHLAEMYGYLGAAYEGEYEFQKALESYAEALKIDSYSPTPYIKVIDVLVKMNRMDLALEIIDNAKGNTQYNANSNYLSNDFTNAINAKEQEIKDKIAKGYIYRPHKRKDSIK